MNDKCSLLVSSCDAYADLWLPFSQCLDLHWSDRKMDTYIISETKAMDLLGIKFIHSGKSCSDWSSNLINALENIQTEYVCFMLEDFLLRKKVDHSRILYCLEFAERKNADMIRLLTKPTVFTKKSQDEELVGKLSLNAPYRVSCQGSLWRRSTLISLLQPGETAWEFERNGSVRSKKLKLNFYSSRKSVLTYFHHAIERGRWFPWDAWNCRRLGIQCDFHSREIMSWPSGFFWLIRKLFFILKRKFKVFYLGLKNEF